MIKRKGGDLYKVVKNILLEIIKIEGRLV